MGWFSSRSRTHQSLNEVALRKDQGKTPQAGYSGRFRGSIVRRSRTGISIRHNTRGRPAHFRDIPLMYRDERSAELLHEEGRVVAHATRGDELSRNPTIGEELELSVRNQFIGDVWRCEFEIPLAYLPGNVCKFNSYAIHGVGDERVYEALYPVTDGTFTEPDFHRLQFFREINVRRLMPDGYGNQPFIDYKYGDLWNGHY